MFNVLSRPPGSFRGSRSWFFLLAHTHLLVISDSFSSQFGVQENPRARDYSQGKTVSEALVNIREAIELVLEDMESRGEEIPDPSEVIVRNVVVTR